MGVRGPAPLRLLGFSAAACVLGVFVAAAAPACTVFNDVTAEPAPIELPVPEYFLSLEDGAQVCSKLAVCSELAPSIIISGGVPVDPVNFSLCMTWVAGPIPADRIGLAIQREMLLCFAGAESCLAAGSCLSVEIMLPGDARCVGATEPERCSADGTTVLRCGDFSDAIHCTSPVFGPDSSCRTGTDGFPACSYADTCDVLNTCDGSLHTFCTFGALAARLDCTALGNTCGVDSFIGQADCLTDGHFEGCFNTGSSCDGDRVKICDSATQSIYDCAAIGGTCESDLGPPRCARPVDVCTPFDADVNLCEGTTAKLCVGGQRIDFDCASIGKACTGSGCS